MAFSPDRPGGKLIVCAGMAVIDQIYRVSAFPVPGTKNRADAFQTVLGGCAANAALAIHRLGGRARVVAPLGGPAGEDLTGDAVLARLEREAIDSSHVVRLDGARTSQSTILVESGGERIIVSYRDPALEKARPRDAARIVADADAVLVDNRFPEFALPVADAAAALGRIVVLDGDRPAGRDDVLLARATHAVFSADGLRGTAGIDDLPDALRAVADSTGAFVAVTNGAQDMLWLEEGRLQRLPAFRIDAVDTLAAGDVFHGAFALALAEGADAASAMHFAAAVAALKCTRVGGGEGAPHRTDVREFILNQSEK